MSEAYFPESLSTSIKLKQDKYLDLIMGIKLELGRLDGMLRHNPVEPIVKAFFRAEEALASASLEFSELSFEEYIEKLLDRGYGGDELNEIAFMVDFYPEMNKKIEERGFSISALDVFQKALIGFKHGRQTTRKNIFRRRQPWLYDAIMGKEEYDIRLHAFPDQEEKEKLLESLDNFIRKNKMEPLLIIAIAYGQLAMIHPWDYGNGRATGALIPYIFNYYGLTRERSFYLSGAFSWEKEDYFERLINLFQEQNWYEWVQYFLEKIYKQVISGQKKVEHIIRFRNTVKEELLETIFSKRTIYQVDLMLQHPVFQMGEFNRKYGFNRGNTTFYVQHMTEAGFLLKDNRKSYINFIFKEVFEIMDL